MCPQPPFKFIWLCHVLRAWLHKPGACSFKLQWIWSHKPTWNLLFFIWVLKLSLVLSSYSAIFRFFFDPFCTHIKGLFPIWELCFDVFAIPEIFTNVFNLYGCRNKFKIRCDDKILGKMPYGYLSLWQEMSEQFAWMSTSPLKCSPT